MAVVAYTKDDLPPSVDFSGVNVITWTGLGDADTGAPLAAPRKADRTVQVVGTFGGTVSIEGSLDGSTYFTLTDPQGSPLEFAADGLSAVAEVVSYIRPAAGAGVDSVEVKLLVRGVV